MREGTIPPFHNLTFEPEVTFCVQGVLAPLTREREPGCTVQLDSMSGNTGARIIGSSTLAAFSAPDTGTTACVAVRR